MEVVVTFTFALHRGNSPSYPLDWRLGGSQNRSGYGIEERKIPALPVFVFFFFHEY